MNQLLPLLVLAIPAIGAIVGALLPRAGSAPRNWALLVSLATLGVAIAIAAKFDFHHTIDPRAPDAIEKSVQLEFGNPATQSATPLQRAGERSTDWSFGVSGIGFYFHLGIDSISLWLVLLTALLQPLALAASFSAIQDRAKEYYAWMLLLLTAMLGCFIARDVLLFYVFFELTLIPMFFIIGIWGGPERRYAAGKFFLFTFVGSVFTLAGVIYLGLNNPDAAHAFDLASLTRFAQFGLTSTQRFWVLLAFLAGFAVKVPLFPVHTWLPLAHTEAPTAGSVILAGVLLKLGTYGLLRFAAPMGIVGSTDPRTFAMISIIAILCILGIIYGALVAWVQQDIKKLVAYSSVSHLGFCVLGLIALNQIGLQGSVLYMINHGLSTGALFLVIGMIYERFHTRDINELSGLARRMPKFAFFFVLFALSSIGLPGLNGFVSEFLTVLGAFTSKQLGPAYAAFAATGVILGAVYMLHMVGRVIWGPLKIPVEHAGKHRDEETHATPRLPIDIGARETWILVPIAILVVLLGILPARVMDSMEGPLEVIRQPLAKIEPPRRTPRQPRVALERLETRRDLAGAVLATRTNRSVTVSARDSGTETR